MPPGVCSQLAYFRINRCGIFFGWNMSVVWSFWPNGIIFHLDFDAFIGLSDSIAAISGLDRVRESLEGTMNRSCWWDISSRKNIACFDPSWWSFNLLHVFFIDVHVTFTTWTTVRSGTRPGPKVGHRRSMNNDGVAWHRGEVVKIPFQSRKGCALVGRTVYQGRPHPDDVSVQVTNSNVQWSTDGDDMTDVFSYLFDSLFESQIFKIIQNTKN